MDNPFSNPLIPQREIKDAQGNVIDRELGLWACFANFDWQYVYKNYGYALGIWMRSSESYKAFVSAVWDCAVNGPVELALKLAMSAMTGIQFAIDEEVVSQIVSDSYGLYIITPLHSYAFNVNATPLVTVGQTVVPGDSLVDSLQVIEPSLTTNYANVANYLVISDRIATVKPGTTLIAENAKLPITYVNSDGQGRAIVQFQLHGDADAKNWYWQEVQNRGIAQGKTLAEYLDTRGTPVGQPTINDLPATINPFEFYIQEVMKNNYYLIKVNPAQFAPGSIGLAGFTYLRNRLPPYTSFLIFVEFSGGSEYYTVSDMTDTSEVLCEGMSLQESVTSTSITDLGPNIKSFPERCR